MTGEQHAEALKLAQAIIDGSGPYSDTEDFFTLAYALVDLSRIRDEQAERIRELDRSHLAPAPHPDTIRLDKLENANSPFDPSMPLIWVVDAMRNSKIGVRAAIDEVFGFGLFGDIPFDVRHPADWFQRVEVNQTWTGLMS